MTPCLTLSVSIARPADDVYDYLADPRSFPEWSDFITKVEPEGEDWIATTPDSTVRIRFTPRNSFRVLDHVVTVSPQLRVHVPMRVVPNGDDGAEVLFTVFRQPGMSDAQFAADVELVRVDLDNLKRILDAKPR